MRYLEIGILVLSLMLVQQANALECLPTCQTNDGRYMSVPGAGLATIAGTETLANFIAAGDNLEIAIFDGDATLLWDAFNGDPNRLLLRFELFADPMGDGSGVGAALATWTSDGSSGLNTGQPMPNNDWFDIVFPNHPSALNANGEYVYTLRAFPINALSPGTSNSFKLRTNDSIYVPAMNPISFIVQLGNPENEEVLVEGFMTIYPNVTCNNNSPTCADGFCGLPPGDSCDPTDPSCCLFETTYDGTWRFFMEVPAGLTQLDVWDGDFDVGNYDNTTLDTNDPNTPGNPFLPPWALGTAAIFQAAQG